MIKQKAAAARKRDMGRDTIIRIWQQSTARGGSFDKALGEAIVAADDNNLRRLYATFPHMWELYGEATA